MIAAAVTKISVVEFDLVGCFGDDGNVTLAAGPEGSAAATVAACDGGICSFSGVVRIKCTGAMLGGALRGRTSLGGTLLDGALAVGTVAVGTFWGGTGPGGTGLGGTGLGGTGLGTAWLGGIWPLSARAGFGALRGGT